MPVPTVTPAAAGSAAVVWELSLVSGERCGPHGSIAGKAVTLRAKSRTACKAYLAADTQRCSIAGMRFGYPDQAGVQWLLEGVHGMPGVYRIAAKVRRALPMCCSAVVGHRRIWCWKASRQRCGRCIQWLPADSLLRPKVTLK